MCAQSDGYFHTLFSFAIGFAASIFSKHHILQCIPSLACIFYFHLSESGSLLFVSTIDLYPILLSSFCRLRGESYGLGLGNDC